MNMCPPAPAAPPPSASVGFIHRVFTVFMLGRRDTPISHLTTPLTSRPAGRPASYLSRSFPLPLPLFPVPRILKDRRLSPISTFETAVALRNATNAMAFALPHTPACLPHRLSGGTIHPSSPMGVRGGDRPRPSVRSEL